MTGDIHAHGDDMGGSLTKLFGQEMTDVNACCADCGAVNELASLTLYEEAHGKVMRCPECASVMFVAAEGLAGLRFSFGSVQWVETVERSFSRWG